MLKLAFECNILCAVFTYAPQSRLIVEQKTIFLASFVGVEDDYLLLMCSLQQIYIGIITTGYKGIYVGYGFRERNVMVSIYRVYRES